MSRLFDDASSEYIDNTSGSFTLTSPPQAYVAWFYSDDLTTAQSIISIADKDAADYITLHARGVTGGDPVSIASTWGSVPLALTTTGYSANTWHHACGLFASTTDWRVFIDGGSKGTATASSTPINIDSFQISGTADSTPTSFMSGRIAEAAIWDLSSWPGATGPLKADGFENNVLPALAAGYSPLFWPLGLTVYVPLVRTIFDYKGHLLNTSGTTVADHPRIIYSWRHSLNFRRSLSLVNTVTPTDSFTIEDPRRRTVESQLF